MRPYNVDPHAKYDVFSRSGTFTSEIDEVRDSVSKTLSDWRMFQRTDVGRKCVRLAQPMIDHLNNILSMSTDTLRRYFNDRFLVNASKEELDEYRAEARGELRVWTLILRRPEELERRLKELEDQEKLEEDASKSEEPVPEEVSKFTEYV